MARRSHCHALLIVCLSFIAGPAVHSSFGQASGPIVPPPVPPATVARDDNGQATVRAVRIQRPLQLDGRLDEEVYEQTPPIDGFIQQEPSEGAPASEKTHVWIFFDERNVYV